MHKGGVADKVGNRYEARWTLHQLLGLLDGGVRSITIEALGDEEQGFEFSLERAGGGIEWHQCKRQTSTGSWTIAALAAAGVLAAFSAKVARGERCVFVSSDPAGPLTSLQSKLPAASTLDPFEGSLSQVETKTWSVLKGRLATDGEAALRFLTLTEFRTFHENDVADMLRARVAYWFEGDPDAIAAQLRAWIEDDRNFNRPLGYDDLLTFVADAGLRVKQYELDRSLPGRIRDANASYADTYPEIGDGLFRIEREAVRDVRAGLEARSGVVLLAGPAGIGKSAILHDVIEALELEGVLHLAFRVDQEGGVSSLDELGKRMVGTADNPVIILEQLAKGGRAVLIVDQVDAVSEVSGRIAELRRVILDLVRKARQYPSVQVVFSCRSFDLDNDHAFRDIADRPGNIRVDVKPFDPDEVRPVLVKLGIHVDTGNARLMTLLCLPIGLSLAAKLSRSGITDLRTVEHLSELYQRLLIVRDQEIQREFRPGWSIFGPLTALASAMSERQELVAPLAELDRFAGSVDILQRLGLIVVRGSRIGFLHESLFDFLHAREFVQGRGALLDFLLASEQSLFRRTQVRQILAFERDLEPARYLADLEILLSDPRVRPHIREAVVRWLATVLDPTIAEWRLVEAYAKTDGLPKRSGNVIYERFPWFELLRVNGIIDAWFETDGDDLRWAMNIARSVAPHAPEVVAEIFNRFLERRPECVREVFGALRWVDPKANPAPLADTLIAALGRAVPADWEAERSEWDDYYGSWIKTAPAEAARIFGAQFARWFRLNPEGHPFKRRYESGGTGLHWVNELAKAAPKAFLEQILPFMRLAMERMAREGPAPVDDVIWHWRRWDRTDTRMVELLDIVRSALAEVAVTDPNAAAALLRSIEPDRFLTSLHLLLETVAANGAGLHGLLVEQLHNPGLFKAGWQSADAYSAGIALAAAMPHMLPAVAGRFEEAVLALHPEIAYASRSLARRHEVTLPAEGEATPPPVPIKAMLGQYATLSLATSGLQQWSVLRQIGVANLSAKGGRRLAEYDRKFVGVEPETPSGISGGMVRSPIHRDRTKLMNDDAWLRAMEKFSKGRAEGDWGWGRDGIRGGARELAQELKECAKENPARFLALMDLIPAGAHESFAWGIVSGISETKPDTAMVEAVISATLRNPASRPDHRTMIWLAQAMSGEMGPLAEVVVLSVALGGDNDTGMGDSSSSGERVEPDWQLALNLGGIHSGKAINSARGAALELLGAECWRSEERYAHYAPALDKVIGAEAPAYIHSSLHNLLIAGLKHAKRTGWVLRTAHACPDSLFGHGQNVLAWVAEIDGAAFSDLMEIYLFSDDALCRAFGSLAVFQRALDDPAWRTTADTLIAASDQYRSAAAAVATANFQSKRANTLCSDWLRRFLDDDSAIVRQEATDCFRRLKHENIGEHIALFDTYVSSRFFEAERSYFLHRLENAPGAAEDIVLKLLEDTLEASGREGRERRSYELRDVGELALKIYAANAGDTNKRRRALDIIDKLVDDGLMDMAKLEPA